MHTDPAPGLGAGICIYCFGEETKQVSIGRMKVLSPVMVTQEQSIGN